MVNAEVEEGEEEEKKVAEALGMETNKDKGGHGHGHSSHHSKRASSGNHHNDGHQDSSETHEPETSQKKEPLARSLKSLVAKSKAIAKLDELQSKFANVDTDQPFVLLLTRLRGVLTDLLWQAKTICVMVVGVAIKLALYNPSAEADAFFAREQRILLGLPLSILFTIQANHAFIVDWHNYRYLHWVKKDSVHFLVICARLVLGVAQFGVCLIDMQPFVFVPVQALFCVSQLVLLHVMFQVFPLSDYKPHPLESVPYVLNAMRVHRKIAQHELAANLTRKGRGSSKAATSTNRSPGAVKV